MSDLLSLSLQIRQFVDERDWAQFHDPKSVFIALTGEVGEVAELLQWLPAESAAALLAEETLQGAMADELADVLIYLLRLADVCGIDLSAAAVQKLEKNGLKYPADISRGSSAKR